MLLNSFWNLNSPPKSTLLNIYVCVSSSWRLIPTYLIVKEVLSCIQTFQLITKVLILQLNV